MASIVISASLNDRPIKESAERTKNVFTAVFADLERKAEAVARKLGGLGGGNNDAARQFERVRQSTQAAESQTIKLAQAQARLQATSGDLASSQRTLRTALENVDKSSVSAIRAQTQLAATQNKLDQQTRRLADGMQSLGTSLTVGVTAPFLLASREILKVGIDYEKSLNLFKAATRATAEQMALASAEAKKLGADITLPATSAGDAARAMTELAKAGLSVSESIAATRGTLQLAAAANLDEARAAEIAANALNAFGLKGTDAAKVADLLAAAANASSAEINDVALAMQQSSATAATLKVPISDLTIAIAAMANAGIKGSDAGTSLKTAFINLNPASNKAAEAMASIGFNAFNATGQLKPLRQLIEEFTSKTKDLTDQQRLQTTQQIFGTDALRAALIVFGGGVEQYDKLSKAINQQGAAAELAAARTKGLGGAWEAFKSQLETGAIVIFEKLSPTLENVVRQLADMAGKVIDVGAKFAEAHPQITLTAAAFIAATAAAGPLLFVVGSLAKSVIALREAALIATGAEGLGALGPTFAIVAAFIAGAIIEVIALREAYKTNFGGLRDSVQGFVAEATAFWAKYGQDIKDITQLAWYIVKTYIVDTVTGIIETVRGLLGLLNGNWESGLRSLLTGAEKILSVLVPTFVKTGQEIVKGLIDGIVSKASDVKETLKAIALGALNAAKLTLGIQSPSKEFFRIGELTIDGLILGARSKAQQAETEFKKIQKAVIKAATPPDIAAGLREQEAIRRERQYLLGFIPTPTAGPIPGGDIPTPKAIRDAIAAASEIPPPPPIAAEFEKATGFAKGFLDAIETTDQIFERFGSNVSRALLSVTGIVKGLGQALKNLALDLVGNALQRGFANLLGGIFGNGTGNQSGSNGGGIGGFFKSFFGGSGGINNSFRTASFNPASSGGSNFFSQLSGLNFGISAPPSITGAPGSVGTATRVGSSAINNATNNGGLFSRLSGFGSKLFSGAGGALLPLLGAGLGSSIGGESGLGRILGGIGGGAVGLGLSYGASVFGALGGGLGALGPALLAALGPAALIGAPLLIGALLLGKAKARRKDEATSGDSLQKAIDSIRSLKRDVIGDRVVGESATRGIFNEEILKTFIAETNALKTRSVRESRLRNQVPDLRRLFEAEVIPELLKQATRQIVNSKLIPEFATGIFGTREGLAYLHDGEAVLNRAHQARLVAMTNPAIFNQIGVPKAPVVAPSGVQQYANGGFFTHSASSGGSLQPIVVRIDNVTLAVTEEDAAKFIARGVSTLDGRRAVFTAVAAEQVSRR